MHRVSWPVMGTVASLATEHPVPAAILAAVREVLADADARFSLYRPDSELARIARGALPLAEASVPLRDAYLEATKWRSRTDGAFTAHRPDGVLDLSGVVKARAMRDAARVLDGAAAGPWVFGVGGDLAWSAGEHASALGIVDPADRGRMLTAVRPAPDHRALATSGSAERGDHIWTRLDLPRSPYLQVSVAADDIVTGDVLATAIVAGGERTLDEACERWHIDVLTIDRDGALRATPGMRAAIERAAA